MVIDVLYGYSLYLEIDRVLSIEPKTVKEIAKEVMNNTEHLDNDYQIQKLQLRIYKRLKKAYTVGQVAREEERTTTKVPRHKYFKI